MSLLLVHAVANIEKLDNPHLGRLLVLLRSADRRKTSPSTRKKTIEGITKLAKMDFLLRYPTCLERVLRWIGREPADAKVQLRERTSIEAKMIRFRYGPWDARYRRWLSLLHARGLIRLSVDGNTVNIGLTDQGRRIADSFCQQPSFADLVDRADVIAKAVGGVSGTALKNIVYDALPEIIDMKWGEQILL